MSTNDEAHPNANGRRRFLKQTATLGAGAALAAQAPALFAQTKAPLKIGVLNSFSKSFAAIGNANLNAMTMYFEQIGMQIAGRKIEIIREDDEINPQVGLQKLKKLVESDKCDIVCGVQASNVMMAIVEYLRQSKQFFICSGAGTSALSYVKVPNLFRVSTSGWQNHYPMGKWVFDHMAKEALLTGSDFAGGHDVLHEFKAGFVKAGGKVIKEIYPPLGTNDFSAYLSDIRSIDPPMTYHFYAGTDAVRFVKQYSEFGLKGKIKIASSGFMVENDVLPAEGKDALGIFSSLHYADTLDNPANKKFVADYRAKFNEFPSVYAEYGYVCARVIEKLLQATDGNTQDRDKLQAAMLNIKFNAPRGPFSMDANSHNVVNPMYVREVAMVDGRVANKVLDVVKDLHDPLVRS